MRPQAVHGHPQPILPCDVHSLSEHRLHVALPRTISITILFRPTTMTCFIFLQRFFFKLACAHGLQAGVNFGMRLWKKVGALAKKRTTPINHHHIICPTRGAGLGKAINDVLHGVHGDPSS